MIMKTRVHVTVKGMVQGVGFRYWARNEALRLMLTGFVKNTSDGKVEAVFEGDEKNVKKMVDLCAEGPSASEVEDVDVKWEKYKGDFGSFGIRY